MSNLASELGITGIKLTGSINRYKDADLLESSEVNWVGMEGRASAEAKDWIVSAASKGHVDNIEGMELNTVFHSLHSSDQSTVALTFRWDDWSVHNYVLVPGAVYAGNRFEVRDLAYAPCWSRLADYGPDVPTIITDIPRLSNEAGMDSAFHLLTGDAATPAIGFIDEAATIGWLILTDQATALGDTSMHMEENADRSSMIISLQAPGVRPKQKYEMATTRIPSTDKAHDFAAGETVKLSCRVYRFPCSNVQELFNQFALVRQQGQKLNEPVRTLPFSAAWEIQEHKYNQMNWNGELGYYAVGTVDSKHQDWQVGWVGGGMSSLALLIEGNDLSAERALRTIDFLFSSQTESGFFHGVCFSGQWYGDEFNDDPDRLYPEQWHILRKSADALYFIMKHLLVLKQMRPEFSIPERWLEGTRRLADAFIRLWREHGQFGQWVHSGTGAMLIGGSAGAAIAPAGLALCGTYFNNEAYSEIAKQSAEYYYQQFTFKGITTGGPGEILQCPDSESAFALLEAYIVLYETNEDETWLERAEQAAIQSMSWCVSYDFNFPEDSTFAKLDIRTTGSVIANAQNKHSAPGICTLSGDSLFKLYRATGNHVYMNLLREIASNLPQYLSRKDRPIRGWDGLDMLPGYMSERVNMSDWEGKEYVGEVLPCSCWCEVSLMLAYTELPGIYINLTSGQVTVLDQVTCNLQLMEDGSYVLTVSNPSDYDVRVKLLAESENQVKRPLGSTAYIGWQRLELAPGETLKITLK